MTIEQVETAALGLSREDRARLAQALIASLEDDTPLEEAWYDAAERRLAQLEAGQAREIPAADVFASFGLDRRP
jgi:putative addiction module component (TIGR02574 family)